MAVHWGYIGEKGPAHWCDDFPDANGNRQSPIDIVTKDAKVDSSLGPLNINYSSARSTCTEVINNGHTFQVNAQSSDTNLSGGPLSHNYRLAQFHCHWGSNDGQGSEHTVDGRPYDAELHLVHWNTDLFQSVGDALPKDKGLAVLTAFLKVGQENTGWSKLVALLNHIKCKIASLRDLLSHKQNEQPACGCQEHLSDNYRPTMPLNGRVVTASFQEQ
ncbi:carbonic anhydrase 1-like isoform X2 [Acanthaster planci]|uniref:Carbonic anhydrase n=1 Tax=Acanthaster planci TaxID=133434 RepID=A0A8B7Z001_ACAPL|nr:carbonic anhydrase 1-like isoform X2 [Acanthaster planci]